MATPVRDGKFAMMLHATCTKIPPTAIGGQICRATSLAIVACAIVATSALASTSQQRCTYLIRDSLYGQVGTYNTVVEKNDGSTTVTTTAHIDVSVLGIVVYNQELARTERWADGRLMSFHGVTTENGTSTEVTGWAEGDHFIVDSANGQVTAPAKIRSANPWFTASSGEETLMMPDTGLITRMHADGGVETTIELDGPSKHVRRYHIETASPQEEYRVWLDDSGTPLMFDIKDGDGTDTFKLVSCQ